MSLFPWLLPVWFSGHLDVEEPPAGGGRVGVSSGGSMTRLARLNITSCSDSLKLANVKTSRAPKRSPVFRMSEFRSWYPGIIIGIRTV